MSNVIVFLNPSPQPQPQPQPSPIKFKTRLEPRGLALKSHSWARACQGFLKTRSVAVVKAKNGIDVVLPSHRDHRNQQV